MASLEPRLKTSYMSSVPRCVMMCSGDKQLKPKFIILSAVSFHGPSSHLTPVVSKH